MFASWVAFQEFDMCYQIFCAHRRVCPLRLYWKVEFPSQAEKGLQFGVYALDPEFYLTSQVFRQVFFLNFIKDWVGNLLQNINNIFGFGYTKELQLVATKRASVYYLTPFSMGFIVYAPFFQVFNLWTNSVKGACRC